MTRILVADDHAIVRAGYRQFLESSSRIIEVGEAASTAEALSLLEKDRWDLLLLDIHMPARTGLDILSELKERFPNTRVLVISGLPERQYAVDVLRAGAAGYLSKSSAPEELLTAVNKVLSGHRYVSAALAEQMASEVGKPGMSRYEQLSTREVQVFKRLASGASITGVATELSLSVKTVSTYRTRILEKMGFMSNAEITAYAIRHDVEVG